MKALRDIFSMINPTLYSHWHGLGINVLGFPTGGGEGY
jgi:hypothetical protein